MKKLYELTYDRGTDKYVIFELDIVCGRKCPSVLTWGTIKAHDVMSAVHIIGYIRGNPVFVCAPDELFNL